MEATFRLVSDYNRKKGTGRIRSVGLACGFISLVGIFYLLTLREGHTWGDDFALYISHARNIAEGRPYRDTGYLYNPFVPSLSPRIYPPVFPLMLAPAYSWFGLDLGAMKLIMVVVFLGFLGVCWWGFGKHLCLLHRASLIALLGFHPLYWIFKDRILSDIPFLFWTYAWLFAVDRAQAMEAGGKSKTIAVALMIGALTYLAYGTRSVGLVLVPSLWIADILRARRISRMTIAATVVFALAFAFQTSFLGSSDSSYLDQFTESPFKVVRRNLTGYLEAFVDLWQGNLPKVWRFAVLGASGLLALAGYGARVRERVSIFEVFLPLYAVAILVWPAFQGGRFLLPLLPLFLFYALVGLERLGQRFPRRIEGWGWCALAAGLASLYAGSYAAADFGPLRKGIGKRESQELFQAVRDATDPHAVLVFRKPRAMALFTRRKVSGYHIPQADKEFWEYLGQIRATHIVVGLVNEPDFRTDRSFLLPFVERNASAFQDVYTNSDFKVFRLNPRHNAYSSNSSKAGGHN